MAFSFNIVITRTQNRSHLLYKQRINYEKFLDVPPIPYKKTVSFVNFKHSTMATYPCVICKIHVRLRQQALECDGCFQWQHRLCNSGNFSFFLWAATYQISKTNIQKSPRTSYNTPGPLRGKDSPHVWVSAWSWQPLCAISISYCSILWLWLILSKIMC